MNLKYIDCDGEKCTVYENGLCNNAAEYMVSEIIEDNSDYAIESMNSEELEVRIFICQDHKQKYTGCDDPECKCDSDTYCDYCVAKQCNGRDCSSCNGCCCSGKAMP